MRFQTPSARRAQELRALGYSSFRQGNYARALKHFERALALFRQAYGGAHPEVATALSDLGAAAASLGHNADARAHHAAALQLRRAALSDMHPDVAASLNNLAAVLRELGELDQATACHAEAIAIWREALGPTHPALGRAFAAQGDTLALMGDYAGAEAAWRDALAFGNGDAGLFHRLGMARLAVHDFNEAAAWFAETVAADPGLLEARHDLAVTLSRAGRHAEAAAARAASLARQCVFVQHATAPVCRVLILAGADLGNVPVDHLLPRSAVTRIWWFIEHARDAGRPNLPAFDAVFNGIGDPDFMAPAEANMAAFLRVYPGRVLNSPAGVERTRRDRLPATIGALPGVVVPAVCRLTGCGLRRQIEAAGFSPPLLLRPAGSHGGEGVIKAEHWADVQAAEARIGEGGYASAFVDYRSVDGAFRKYRVVFVDRRAFPYHLAISPDWMVHYFSADMAAHRWKLAEEAEFLTDWQTAIGPGAARQIVEIGRRLDLDYCGIDFAIGRNGEVIVFEANATMLIHPEAADSPLAFKNAAVSRITEAMLAMALGAAEIR